MKRLLILTRLYYPEGSGAELATHLLVRQVLSKIFDEILILTGSNVSSQNHPPNVRIKFTPLLAGTKPEIIAKTLFIKRILSKLLPRHNAVYIPSNALLHLAHILRNSFHGKIILHLHDYQVISYSSVVLAEIDPSPYIDYIVEKGDRGGIITPILSATFHQTVKLYQEGFWASDVAVAVSRRQAKIIAQALGSKASKQLKVIYNPIPPLENRNNPHTCRKTALVFTGGTRLTKGAPVLAAALARLIREGVSFEAIMTKVERKPPWLVKLSSLANKRGILLHLLPRLPREELETIYREARVYVMPSLYEEPLPYTIIESVFHDMIPVSSYVGGVPELLEGTPADAFIVKPGKPQELATKLAEALSLPPQEIKEIARRVLDKLVDIMSPEVVFEEFSEIFYGR